MNIAILEDDPEQSQVVSLWLELDGHTCTPFYTGSDFIKNAQQTPHDLYLIDWELPDTTGIEVLEWIRKHIESRTPVLFVTVRDEEEDIVKALELGADDYMSKPIKNKELLARVKALARRTDTAPKKQEALTLGEYTVDSAHRRITHHGDEIKLTGTEFELAAFLFRNANHIMSRNNILEHVWQRGPEFNTRTVDTHISRIRKKLSLTPENGWRLSSVYRYGYRLEQLD